MKQTKYRFVEIFQRHYRVSKGRQSGANVASRLFLKKNDETVTSLIDAETRTGV
jgi:hypothetical protein